jgi:hypothetical protein
MDFTAFSLREYGQLIWNYPAVSRGLTLKLERMVRNGFDPNNGYLYGFSLGAHIVLRATRRFGYQRIREVDGEQFVKNIVNLYLFFC